jgi:hypothetical protein
VHFLPLLVENYSLHNSNDHQTQCKESHGFVGPIRLVTLGTDRFDGLALYLICWLLGGVLLWQGLSLSFPLKVEVYHRARYLMREACSDSPRLQLFTNNEL